MQRSIVIPAVMILWLMAAVPMARATEPTDIAIYPPRGLLSGEVYGPLAGTWYQRSEVRDGYLDAQLTFQLPVAPTREAPGPVVAIWQIVVQVADNAYGDIATRKIGPPQVTAALPICDASGNCAARFDMSGPTDVGYQAHELEWAGRTGLTFAVTLVRTFADGSLLQLVRPDLPVDGGGGNLATPEDMYGALALSGLLARDEALPAEQPGDDFHRGSTNLYDWGQAVRDALPDTESQTPEPLPINVWTPEQPDALHVSLRIDFSDVCPDDRAIVFRRAPGPDASVVVPISGATSVREEVALTIASDWSIGIETGDGTVLNRADLQPLGSGTGLRIGGSIACGDGKGVFTQEGIPQVIPNPSAPTPEPSGEASVPPATLDREDSPMSLVILPLLLVLVIAATVVAIARPWLKATPGSATRPR